MTLEETTQLYASVLRQLLPTGGYDTSPNTEALAVDVYAHAKLLAQADLDGKRLLKVLEELPPELLHEYETEYGLPLKCSINAGRTLEERLEILKWVRSTNNVLNRTYLEQILAIFGIELFELRKYMPMQCTAPCNSALNTEQLRYKVRIVIPDTAPADMDCIIENYLPGYLRVDVLKVPLLFKTSRLYPNLVDEKCAMSFRLNEIMLRSILKEIPVSTEPIKCGFNLSSIQLKENYQKINLQIEEISPAFKISNISLKQVQKSTSLDIEQLSTGFNVLQIVKKDALLSSQLKIETVACSFNLKDIKLV